MRALVVNREVTSAALRLAARAAAVYRLPFPEQDPLLQLVLFQKPALFYGNQSFEWGNQVRLPCHAL